MEMDDNPYRSPESEPERPIVEGNPEAGRSGETLRQALIAGLVFLIVALIVLALVRVAVFNA